MHVDIFEIAPGNLDQQNVQQRGCTQQPAWLANSGVSADAVQSSFRVVNNPNIQSITDSLTRCQPAINRAKHE